MADKKRYHERLTASGIPDSNGCFEILAITAGEGQRLAFQARGARR